MKLKHFSSSHFQIIFTLFLSVLFTGFHSRPALEEPVKNEKISASIDNMVLRVNIKKDDAPITHPLDPGAVTPKLRACQWKVGTTIDPVLEGSVYTHFELDLCAMKHPVKFTIVYPHYELTTNHEYSSDTSKCGSSGNYIIPSLYFDKDDYYVLTTCQPKELAFDMKPAAPIASNANETSNAVEDGLSFSGGAIDNGTGPYVTIEEPTVVQLDSTTLNNIQIWSREYSRLDKKKLSKRFAGYLSYFEEGELIIIVKEIEQLNWDKQIMSVRSFEDKRNWEQIATLAARSYSLLSRVKNRNVRANNNYYRLSKKYYDYARRLAPYQMPSTTEFASYLNYKKDYAEAKKLLKPGSTYSPFPIDKAVLSEHLGYVYSKTNDAERATVAANVAIEIRRQENKVYLDKNVQNVRLIEANKAQIAKLENIEKTRDINTQTINWESLQLDRSYYFNAKTYDRRLISPRVLDNDNIRLNRGGGE